MSKQFTIITKDGSKWLQPINVPYPNADDYEGGNEPHPAFARADAVIYEEMTRPVPYLGSHPEGTTVDESEVREVRQYRKIAAGLDWTTCPSEQVEKAATDRPSFELRTAYTDAEPPDIDYEKEMPHKQWPSTKYVAREVGGDRHASDNPRYPLFSHMSDEHGLTLLDSELDEIAHHAAPMTGVEYWKRRCKIAESMIGMCPSDPKTYDEFCRLYDEWEQIIEEGRAYGN